MKVTIFEAAKELQRKIHAPVGAVNTVAQTQAQHHYIRVLIDPMYWYAVTDVPDEFEGFPVTVEKREPSTPLFSAKR
jgi:hypothetical protein